MGGGGALADAARPAAGRGTVRTHRPAPGDPTPPGPGPAGAGDTGSWPTYERIKAPLARRGNALHAGAWWLWALGLATAASRTTNPLLLGLIVGVAGYVVAARRTSAPWARSYSAFLKLGLFVIGLRLFFSVLLGSPIPGAHTLFTLPELPSPPGRPRASASAGASPPSSSSSPSTTAPSSPPSSSASAPRTPSPTRPGC